MNPQFSIIVPVYNVASYLRECLDSILNQTICEWEAICVDDGSTDSSGEILDEYAIKDKRFKIFHKNNGGVAETRNYGLEFARNEWIIFLDSDDVWHPYTLVVCAQLIKDYPDAQIVRFSRKLFIDGQPIVWDEEEESVKVYVRNLEAGLIDEDMRFSFVCNCCHRSVIPKHGFKKYICGEDLLFRAECLSVAKRMVTTTRCLYAYRTRSGSATQSPINMKKLLDRIGYSIEWLHVLEKKPAPARVQRQIAQNLTESYVRDIVSVDKSDRSELWTAWYDMLPRLIQFQGVRGWYRLIASICLRCKLHCIALLLCALPAEIKRFKRNLVHSRG